MTNAKNFLTAIFALISVFVLTFNTTAWAATATAPTITPEDALKLRTQITDLQTRLDAFDDDTSTDLEQQLPAFYQDIRSSLSDFTSKVITPTTQAKYDSIATKLDSYTTKYDAAKAAYSTAKSDYNAATKIYQDTVKSTYDKVVSSLDKLEKLLPTSPTAE